MLCISVFSLCTPLLSYSGCLCLSPSQTQNTLAAVSSSCMVQGHIHTNVTHCVTGCTDCRLPAGMFVSLIASCTSNTNSKAGMKNKLRTTVSSSLLCKPHHEFIIAPAHSLLLVFNAGAERVTLADYCLKLSFCLSEIYACFSKWLRATSDWT